LRSMISPVGGETQAQVAKVFTRCSGLGSDALNSSLAQLFGLERRG
jgi:hypothetical protein